MQCVIVVFPDHNHLLFNQNKIGGYLAKKKQYVFEFVNILHLSFDEDISSVYHLGTNSHILTGLCEKKN